MDQKFFIEILQDGRSLYREQFSEAVELGRQEQRDPEPLEPLFVKNRARQGQGVRVPIAPKEELNIARHQLLVERAGPTKVRITNISSSTALQVVGHAPLALRQQAEFDSPALVQIGRKCVRVEIEDASQYVSLAYNSLAPGSQRSLTEAPEPQMVLSALSQVHAEPLGKWLEAVVEVLQSATGSEQFYEDAARAVVNLIGFDQGAVVLKTDSQWTVAVRHPPPRRPDAWAPSMQILRRVEKEVTAVCETPKGPADPYASLRNVASVVAAPILDRQSNVIGALYGDRRSNDGGSPVAGISQHELMLVKLLACGVAAGLARLKQEKEAIAAHAVLEQFFTEELANELASKGKLPEGKEFEVTCLFSDIREFSRITENKSRCGEARLIVEWVRSVLTTLSNCVKEEEGVVVDYIGDCIFAMWGAPKLQPDHAERACRAAQAMLRAKAKINEQWQTKLGEETLLGIGINSGTATVGNIGSDLRLKYGPLGSTVNLASRVQGSSKYLHADLIITGSTKALVGDRFPCRRLCSVEVVNIDQPVELYELPVDALDTWADLAGRYTTALELFEKQRFRESAKVLGQLFQSYEGDGPSLALLARAVSCLVDSNADRHPVWKLPGK